MIHCNWFGAPQPSRWCCRYAPAWEMGTPRDVWYQSTSRITLFPRKMGYIDCNFTGSTKNHSKGVGGKSSESQGCGSRFMDEACWSRFITSCLSSQKIRPGLDVKLWDSTLASFLHSGRVLFLFCPDNNGQVAALFADISKLGRSSIGVSVVQPQRWCRFLCLFNSLSHCPKQGPGSRGDRSSICTRRWRTSEASETQEAMAKPSKAWSLGHFEPKIIYIYIIRNFSPMAVLYWG